MNVADQFMEQAQRAPSSIALASGTRVVSYSELAARAQALSGRLASLGAGPEMVVGLYAQRSVEYVIGALGILLSGAAYLPLDPAYPADRLGFMLRDAQASLVVAQPCLGDRLPRGPWMLLAPEAGPVVSPGPANGQRGQRPEKNTLAYVIYTSGSTGEPRGVEIAHASLSNLLQWHQRAFDVSADDRAAQIASPGFDAAVWELWPYLTRGASVHIPDDETRSSPAALRDWIVANAITIAFVPTPLAERMIRLDWPTDAALRILLTGADRLHTYPPRRLAFDLVNNYGPTECTVVASSGLVPKVARPDRMPTIGKPIDGTQIYILDENLKPVSAGVPGTIFIGGRGVARGYRNRADLTADKFVRNRFEPTSDARMFNTGDLGRQLENGEIEFLGRSDDQVKIRGMRVELDEIASLLDEHPDIEASAVRACDDASGEKRLVAYVVARPGANPRGQDLRTALRQRLPEYMVPAQFVLTDALPITAHGKIDKAKLPAPSALNLLQEAPSALPRSPLEKRVADIVGGLLGLDAVGADDNFFLLGGHSFLGTQLIARVRKAFGVDLTLRMLFENPTVAAMSDQIESLIEAKLEAMSEDEAVAMLGRMAHLESA